MLSEPVNESVAATLTLHQEFLTSASLGREVELSIVVPAEWNPAIERAYQVLYLNDGQDLPRLHLLATLETLYAQHVLQPFVLVAIHANDQRMYEYGVAAQADYNGRGNKAADYTRFVLDELLPFAQHRYKVSANPAEAVFAGFSLGGLTAFDLVWHHPELFARAGVFSGSFWWRSRALDDDYTPADRIMHRLVQARLPHPTHQFWFQTGTLDERGDRNENGVIDAIDDCLDLIENIIHQGFNAEKQLRYVQVEAGRHHPDTWGRIMPDFLQWAFGAAAAQPLAQPLPMVRAQLHQLAELEPEPVATPAATETAAHLLAVEAAVSTEILNIITEAPTETESPADFPTTLSHFMSITRPAEGDFLPYYATYINLVPNNADPRQLLHEQTAEVQATFGVLSEEQARQVYAPGKWTSKQMLLHIIDTERVFTYRALRFARGDAQALAGFDENDYAESGGANARLMSDLLAEYAAVRAATLALVNSFTPEQLRQRGTANNAEVTVNALLYILPGHERHHLNVWRERYAPVLGIS